MPRTNAARQDSIQKWEAQIMQRRTQASVPGCLWTIRTVALLGLLTLSLGAAAQGGGNVAITGTVLDPSGAVVPSARVSVTQKSTGIVRADTTNSNGQFNFPSL